jgi:glycosyltransferase involved in cell wall biosynthesis
LINKLFCLDPEYSTTRRVARTPPVIREEPETMLKTQLFLPPKPSPKEEGGLRVQGYFKVMGYLNHNSEETEALPLVTVITVVFNGATHLEQTILSVLNQNYDNVEYVVIDGGSTDGTLDIIRKYEHAIDYWVSGKDGGIADAFNIGLKCSTGDYINFLNCADSFVDEEVISLIAKNLYTKDIVTGFACTKIGRMPKAIKLNSESLLMKALISHQASFIKRSIFESEGMFDESLKIRMDYDFWFRVLSKHEFQFLPFDLVNYDAGASASNPYQYYFEEIKIHKLYLENKLWVLRGVVLPNFVNLKLHGGNDLNRVFSLMFQNYKTDWLFWAWCVPIFFMPTFLVRIAKKGFLLIRKISTRV